MSAHSPFRRRPSASLVISMVALFVALGGVGWAATQLPARSVGTRQLKRGAVGTAQLKLAAVTNAKLARRSVRPSNVTPRAIGRVQINPAQVQERVLQSCGGTGAIQSISRTGGVTCSPPVSAPTSSGPDEFGAGNGLVTISGTTPSTIVTKSLPAGSSYLVLGEPFITVAGSVDNQQVVVECTLAVGSTSTTRAWTVQIGTGHPYVQNSIPLPLAVGKLSAATDATVACSTAASSGNAPVVAATGTVNAIQTAKNG